MANGAVGRAGTAVHRERTSSRAALLVTAE
jgi:hypothetical protein